MSLVQVRSPEIVKLVQMEHELKNWMEEQKLDRFQQNMLISSIGRKPCKKADFHASKFNCNFTKSKVEKIF